MAIFDSYKDPLTKVMEILALKKKAPVIVEYGPGGSTKLMKNLLPEAQILSIEHKHKWYTHYLKEFSHNGYSDISLYHVPISYGYINFPLYKFEPGEVDLAYIDGRKRYSCMKAAMQLLDKKNGFIVIHDAERLRYRKCLKLWDDNVVWFGRKFSKTVVFASNPEDTKRLKSI